jgi:hypothetical protein
MLKYKKMKSLTYSVLAFCISLFIIMGCNKYGDLYGSPGPLVASKSAVEINEPDSLLLVGAKATDSLLWSVVPSGYDTLVTRNNAAQIEFTKAGSYTVKVSDKGGTPATTTITVNSSVYVNPNKNTIIPLTGDQITLTPGYFKNKAGDTSFIYFTAQTTDYYCATDRLVFSYYLDGYSNYVLSFTNVQQFNNCTGNTARISAGVNFNQKELTPLPNGTYALTVNLNGITYVGNIVVSSTTINFDWKYTSGVMISPQQINR